MALVFPSSPTVGPPATEYGRWIWSGQAWVPKPTVLAPMLPISGGTLTGPGNLTVMGTTNLASLQASGQVAFLDGVTKEGEDVATQKYVDEAVASGGLWQGTWDASTNTPDLTDPDLHFNGWTWAILTPDPAASFAIPASPAIPGLSGQTVYNGDHAIWSDVVSAFEIVHGSSLSLAEAEDMFLKRTTDSFTGTLTVTSPGMSYSGTLNAQQAVLAPNMGASAADAGAVYVGPYGEVIISSGTQFEVHGSLHFSQGQPSFGGGAGFSGGNVSITGAGTTTPTATGNLNISSTHGLNGNINTSGSITMTGPNRILSLTGANSQYAQSFGYFSAPGGFSGYQGGAPNYDSYTVVLNGGMAWQNITRPNFGWGRYVQIGGTEPCPLYWHNIRYDSSTHAGISASYDGSYAGLAFFAAGGPYGTVYGSFPGGAGYANPEIMRLKLRQGSQAILEAAQYANKPGGGAWGALSDVRTKTDVHPYGAGLAALTKLNPITYRYNGRARMPETGKSYVGLHAEEARDVMPEMVTGIKGKLDYDDDAETDILHLDATALPFAIINALKEITRRLEALEAKLA